MFGWCYGAASLARIYFKTTITDTLSEVGTDLGRSCAMRDEFFWDVIIRRRHANVIDVASDNATIPRGDSK